MISEAATFIFDALRRDIDVLLSLPRTTLRARTGESPTAMFRALALLEPVYEPVAQAIDRNAMVFSVRRGDERATA